MVTYYIKNSELIVDENDYIWCVPCRGRCKPIIIKVEKSYKVQYFDFELKKMRCKSYKSEKEAEIRKCNELTKFETMKDKPFEMKVSHLISLGTKNLDLYRLAPPFVKQYAESPVPIEPYMLGIWLGDGSAHETSITNVDQEIITYLQDFAVRHNLNINAKDILYRFSTKTVETKGKSFTPRTNNEQTVVDYIDAHPEVTIADITNKFDITRSSANRRIKSWKQYGLHKPVNTLLTSLKDLNLIRNKHIPKCYLENSEEVRLQLLAGLIDSDGNLNKSRYEIVQKSEKLLSDIRTLCHSLGFMTTEREKIAFATNAKNHQGTLVYRCFIRGFDLGKIPCLVERKKYKENPAFRMFTQLNFTRLEEDDTLTKQEMIKSKRLKWTDEHDKWMISNESHFLKSNGSRDLVKMAAQFSITFQVSATASQMKGWRTTYKNKNKVPTLIHI